MTEEELTPAQVRQRIADNEAKIAANNATIAANVKHFFARPDVIADYDGNTERMEADRVRLLGPLATSEQPATDSPSVIAFREKLK